MLFGDLPKAVTFWVRRYPFKKQGRRPRTQWAVNDVAVPRNPADVRGAEVNLAWLVLKHIDKGVCRPDHVARTGMHHSLGLPGATTGIQNEQEVLRLHFHSGKGSGLGRKYFVVPHIAAFLHGDGLMGTLVDHDAMYAWTGCESHVDHTLERYRFRTPKRTVAGYEGGSLGIEHPVGNAFRGKAPENDRMHRPHSSAGQNGHRQFRNHAHVDTDPVAFGNTAGL